MEDKYQEALNTLRKDFEEFAVKPNDIGRFFKHSEANEIMQELIVKYELLEKKYKELNIKLKVIEETEDQKILIKSIE